MLEQITVAPPDAILGLTEAYKQDQNPRKINLGVGIYQDEHGRTPILECVKAAEERILASATSKAYQPIPGSAEYGRLTQEILLGEGHPLLGSGRVKTAHTPGGTGALRVGADFLSAFLDERVVWMSSPTWANHKGIFTAAGFSIQEYPYYDAEAHALNAAGMVSALEQVPKGHVVLLQVSCHNPTGVDPSAEHWQAIAALAEERGWIPFLDFAYQGFGVDLETDRLPLAPFLRVGAELFVASSFSKNFGLYQDRTGALTLVGPTLAAAEAAFSHVKKTIRVNYSNPPAHGGEIVRTVLTEASLREQWLEELAGMRNRIKAMRSALVDGLSARGVDRDFGFINAQHGMFSFSGLNDEQVQYLRERKSIYIVKGGRINVAGITSANVDYLCDAIAEALTR